jgi:hypothetical protein
MMAVMQRLSAERFKEAKGYLRRTIPGLFSVIPREERPLYEIPYLHRDSMMGAIAVQRLAGGDIRPIDLNCREVISYGLPRRHVVTAVHGEFFDVFGFVPTDDPRYAGQLLAAEPVPDSQGLVLHVERVLDPVRLELGLPLEVLK